MDRLRIAQFVKDVVAEPDLPSFGLGAPALRITFHPATNTASPAPAIQLDFSAPQDDKVNVRRGDENAVYTVDPGSLNGLPVRDGEFRDRRVWRFDPSQVASATVQRGTRSWQVLRNGTNEWALATGSQGLVNPFAIEETMSRLGRLEAVVWTSWGGGDVAQFGLDDSALVLVIELKDGTKLSVKLGSPAPSSHVFASVTLDGGEWVFEFPLEAYDALRFALLTPSTLR
jgi:hypothetical protein